MLTLKLAGGVILNLVIFGVLLFVPAGTLDWWRAWVLMGVVLIATTATMIGVFGMTRDCSMSGTGRRFSTGSRWPTGSSC